METNENLTEKLKVIGLDLENIPDKLNFFHSINCRMRRNYNEKFYKVYKFIDVNDIDIFLTPAHRLTDYTEKYAKALPLGAYLYTDTDENIARNIEFLKMLKDISIEDIDEIEDKQKSFNKEIPYNVNYGNDYIWQIYYSDITKRYFMLVPTQESENVALFYLIKKQLENKEYKIYVPICYSEYSNRYLNNEEISEIEDYLGYFTKHWPTVYEVYNESNELSIRIVGKCTIYDTLESEYKIELLDEGEAENFYKLIKALFILETQLSSHYKFNVKLDKTGTIHFYFEQKEITYDELITFIKEQYISGLERIIKSKEQKINLNKELKNLKSISKKLDEEYFEREKQISTFLECKKSFFGRVKYFIKYKKKPVGTSQEVTTEKEETNKLKYCERPEIKETYTLEELLTLYKNLDKEVNEIKDLELDIEARNKRIETLKLKIKNANLYIKEIDDHKKSIFDFWKFTNKDDAKQLNEGNVEVPCSKKLKKAFNYEFDFEDLSKQLDKAEREIFSKEETDSIFIATTNCINDINNIINNKEIDSNSFINLKQEMNEKDKVQTIDIFGSIELAGEKTKTLGNIKHRESEKNKFSILNIKEQTTFENYVDKLKEILSSIECSMSKFKNTLEIPIYKVGELEEGLNVFYINPENAFKYATSNNVNLYKVVLKEDVECIPLTNIMYYNNTNKTLPLGMNVTDGILIDTRKVKLELDKKKDNYIIKAKDSEAKPNAVKVNILEYKIC